MNPVVHAELAWLMAQPLTHRRDRVIVTCAGLAPDLDGLSLLAGVEAYDRYHHLITHGVMAALAVTALSVILARQRALVAALAFGAFHLHLLCDVAGSGPGWPIWYLVPFSRRELYWAGQWNLASWQNSVIGLLTTLLCLGCALPFRRTVLEIVAPQWDAVVTATLRRRFGREG